MTAKKGYLLPDPVDGYDLICLTLQIPDVREYRIAVYGALTELGKWWTWEKSGLPDDTRAKEAGEYWRSLIEQYLEIGDCAVPFDVRQNPDTPCILEKSTDGGETWVQFADLTLCPPDIKMIDGVLYEKDGDSYVPVPRQSTGQPPLQPAPRPRTGSAEDNRCNAAANATAAIVALNDAVRQPVLDGKNIFEIVGYVIQIIATIVDITPFSSLIMPTIQQIIDEFDVLSSEYTDPDKDDLRCILYCDASDDGGIVTFDFAHVLLDLEADGRPLFTLAAALLALIGESGLNYAASASTVTGATCSDCVDCTDPSCFTPADTNTHSWISCVGSNHVYFSTDGAHTDIGTSFGDGVYIDLRDIVDFFGIPTDYSGLNVSVKILSPQGYFEWGCATDHTGCGVGYTTKSTTSEDTQFVPADHPFLIVFFRGTTIINEICIEYVP